MSVSRHSIQQRLPRGRRAIVLAALVALVLLVLVRGAGCGQLQAEPSAARIPGVTLTVTDDHGRRVLLDTDRPRPGDGTALGLLAANTRVIRDETSFFVKSVNGAAEGEDALGRPQHWNLILNGTRYGEDRATPQLHRGDHVWWDRREFTTSPTAANPGEVGAFPAPLAGVASGQRPVWLRCETPAGQACERIRAKLGSIGARLAGPVEIRREPQDPAAPIQLIVSRTSALERFDSSTRGFLAPPSDPQLLYVRLSKSGAFHTLDVGGTRLGTAVRARGGFIVAYGGVITRPIWIVAGVDSAGLLRASRAFDTPFLHGHTAIYLDDSGTHPLPESRADLDAADASDA